MADPNKQENSKIARFRENTFNYVIISSICAKNLTAKYFQELTIGKYHNTDTPYIVNENYYTSPKKGTW